MKNDYSCATTKAIVATFIVAVLATFVSGCRDKSASGDANEAATASAALERPALAAAALSKAMAAEAAASAVALAKATAASALDPALAATPTTVAAVDTAPDTPLDNAHTPGGHRMLINRRLAALALPLFWRGDDDGDGQPDEDELVDLVGVWLGSTLRRQDAIARVTAAPLALVGLRAQAVQRELDQGQPTLVLTDLRKAPRWERSLARSLISAAAIIEALYGRQVGSDRLQTQIAGNDALSRALFQRNQGPYCEAPATESDLNCAALDPRPARISGLYPAAIQANRAFCDVIAKRADADDLMAPFVVVRAADNGDLVATPYHLAWPKLAAQVTTHLNAAAGFLPKTEAPFAAYLRAAATAFGNGDWVAADEAWSRMRAENSAWYLRIGPDETYFEPCSRKAGFHMSWARVDKAGLGWKQRLEPLRADLEREVARLSPKPYTAREVAFHLPEFIQIVLNAGDSRSAHGATVGQSLPNFGPVAEQSRGRTVAMTNLYRDPDSIATRETQVNSLLCPDAARLAVESGDAAIVGTVLHEAAHNLGANGSWKVDGRSDDAIFGGSMAATLEELKAQTLALHLNAWLQKTGKLRREEGVSAWLHDITWAFGHISRGMTTPEGKAKPYAQLASVQIGRLLAAKALTWRPQAVAASGVDRGCFSIDIEAVPAAVAALASDVLAVKVRGEPAAAALLIDKWTAETGEHAALRAVIRARWLRAPKATFVYSVAL